MSDKKDDPREVLSLLNSLGFVGITAQQLKAFMKDLKMHRKIKERERQQWKEETKRKILSRQQELYREVLKEHNIENMRLSNATESTISSESSTFHDDSSYKVVTVKIRCIPKDKENTEGEDGGRRKKTAGSSRTHTSWAEEFRQNSLRNSQDDNGYNTSSSTSASVNESHARLDRSDYQSAEASTDSTKYISLEKPRGGDAGIGNLKQSNLPPQKYSTRPKPSSSRQTLRSESLKRSQSIGERSEAPSNPPPSRSSVQSRSKSFIRPWRLQPDSHRSSTNTKSDPVALYQKYREEWKQLALPGEENHAGVRWAVREKMLGTDPNPRLDINSIRDMNRDIEFSSILDYKERKIYRRRSRRLIRKTFFNDFDLIRRNTSSVCRDRFTYFKSVSESFLASKSRDSEGIGNQKSKIEHEFEAESFSRRVILRENLESKETCCAKKILGRLVRKLLDKDLNSYVESYRYMNKCSCVFETENS